VLLNCLPITAILTFYSCDTIETVSLPENPPKLVVNCIGQNTNLYNLDLDFPYFSDSLFTAYVSLSAGILKVQSSFPPVTDAVVNLYENGIFLETLPPSFNTFIQGVYKSKSKCPKPGSTYQIEVISSPNATITASYTQPQPVTVDSIEFTILGPDLFYQSSTDIQVRVSFMDSAGEDYYELSLKGYSADRFNTSEFGLAFVDQAYPKTNGLQLPSGGVIFSDSFFEGKEAILDLSTIRFENSSGTPLKYYTVRLNHISKEYYLYLKTYLLQKQTEGDPYAQPVMVENNIQNGYGIFCGLTTTTKTVVFDK